MADWLNRVLICSVLGAAVSGCVVTPERLTSAELSGLAKGRLDKITTEQEPVYGAIDLYEATARALKYNLDHKVEVFETIVRTAELNVSHYDMLPNMVMNVGYAGRDSVNGSSTLNLITHRRNFGASASQDKETVAADAMFSWNILDFGLSYVRARQAADKVLIAAETRRKVANRIVEDVRTAYWRAVSADRVVARLATLERRTRAALTNAQRVSAEGQTSRLASLTYQRELMEVRRTIQEMQRDLSVSRQQLAALMNLKPGTSFRLAPPRYGGRLALGIPANRMVWVAMHNRPELRENEYRKRINLKEADAQLLALLPGIQAYTGPSYDSNSFLVNQHWVGWGAKVSWNLLNVLKYPAKKAVLAAQDELYEQRARAITMAIMTQVYVSRARFHHFEREFAAASQYASVQRGMVKELRAQAQADRLSEQTLIREEMNTLLADVRRDIAYSSLQNSFANLYASMGLDSVSGEFDVAADVRTLAQQLRDLWQQRAAGRVVQIASRYDRSLQ